MSEGEPKIHHPRCSGVKGQCTCAEIIEAEQNPPWSESRDWG